MRPLLAVLFLAACSSPQALVATKDPVTVTAAAGEPVEAPRTWRFAFDVSREISCSQSFEHDSTYGAYVLSVAPTRVATLRVEQVDSTTFGANRFDKSAPPPSHSEQRSERHFEGTVGRVGGSLSFEFRRRADECGKDASGCGAPLAFSCVLSTASVVSWSDAGKHVDQQPILRCDTAYGLPMELDEGGWKGGLAFGEGSGTFLGYVVSGPMEHPPELRLAP